MPYLKTLDQRHGIRIRGSAVTVGSDPSSHILIRAPFVVAAHQFTLVENGGRYMIQNVDESGRTHVNGQPVQEIWLKDGDVIHAGDLALLYMDEKPGEEDPVLLETKPSTPFQASSSAIEEVLSTGGGTMVADGGELPTDYDSISVSSLSADDTSPINEEQAAYEAQLRAKQRAYAEPSTVRTLSMTWVAVIVIALIYAWWENGPLLVEQVKLWRAARQPIVELVRPKPIGPEMEDHFKAVQLIATLPPETFASIALSDFMTKTQSPWVKQRVEKQLVRALSPIVQNVGDVERLSLIDAALPSSRMVILTLKGRPTLTEVLKDVGDSMLQPLTLNGLNAMRLKTATGQMRHIVEVSPGNLIVTDVSAEKLSAHFEIASRVKRPTGITAMAKMWGGDFMCSVRASVLADTGAEAARSPLTAAPLVTVDFEAIPVGAVILPVEDSLKAGLYEEWSKQVDYMAERLISLGNVADAKIAKSRSGLQFRATLPGGTLLDEVWRRQFNDFDLKFRPLGLALDF